MDNALLENALAVGGIAYLIIGIISLIFGIMAILMPFFVYRIRNEVIEMNERLAILIDMMPRQKDELSTFSMRNE